MLQKSFKLFIRKKFILPNSSLMNEQTNINAKTLEEHFYSLIRPIGKGGTCTVFLVNSIKYHEEFVIKTIPVTNKESTKRSEINALMNLSHPHIINMYEYFYDEFYLYIVLEYCPGGSLNDIIESGGRMETPQLITYCKDIISGLNHCHQNHIAHLDIKPQNILIDRYGRLKLADFGLSLLLNGAHSSNQFAGSRIFMAPEIFQKHTFDPFAADIWSLGVTFFMMATGESPWGNGNKLEIEKAISVGLYYYPDFIDGDFLKLLKKMIDINPSNRITIEKVASLKMFQTSNVVMKSLSLNRSTTIKTQLVKLPTLHLGNTEAPGIQTTSRLRKRLNSMTDNKAMMKDASIAIQSVNLTRHVSIPISKKRQFKVAKSFANL
ncbi:CAMK family protein kinase [Tritrichomonas foetus]|uniref:CAMK family protein kinase n=1 Tax=Tritrichomonas foetus TaxID=1144522 RepID=A0A1J4K7L5_9EUKA|nr:CAMK family protein kinase [Tritrichomonas foetus]|eukprot:OHT06994.1 CAMK family protein kinase [Tritrichomonas foetus]